MLSPIASSRQEMAGVWKDADVLIFLEIGEKKAYKHIANSTIYTVRTKIAACMCVEHPSYTHLNWQHNIYI